MNAILDEVAEFLARISRSGSPINELMRDDERDAGRRVVVPGEAPWLSAADWHSTVVVSVDGRRVRLVLLHALRPGHGSLKRLIAAIKNHGLIPVIVEPGPALAKTLMRWGWKSDVVGRGFHEEEQWCPQ